MPEGVEVKLIARWLDTLLHGQPLHKITILSGPHQKFKEDLQKNLDIILESPTYNKKSIIRFGHVKSHGKFLYFELILFYISHDSEKAHSIRYIGNHLGLTGRWSIETENNIMVDISYGKSHLYYTDMRHFGKFYWLTMDELKEKLKLLGPDVLDGFTEKKFLKIINKEQLQNKMIGALLLDQSIMSGIGNYLRADILYTAKINPKRKVESFTEDDKLKLYAAINHITQLAYSLGGSTAYTGTGTYDPIIYGKKKDPLGNPVKTYQLEGRTMYYVDKIQN